MSFAQDQFGYKESEFDPNKPITLDSKNFNFFQSQEKLANNKKYTTLLNLYKDKNFPLSFSTDKTRFKAYIYC